MVRSVGPYGPDRMLRGTSKVVQAVIEEVTCGSARVLACGRRRWVHMDKHMGKGLYNHYPHALSPPSLLIHGHNHGLLHRGCRSLSQSHSWPHHPHPAHHHAATIYRTFFTAIHTDMIMQSCKAINYKPFKVH